MTSIQDATDGKIPSSPERHDDTDNAPELEALKPRPDRGAKTSKSAKAAKTDVSSMADLLAPPETVEDTGPRRCGTIAIVGKPNVGKSTLLNALVGQKISITSRKAQTTRHRITGMRTRGPVQFVFVDTPGFQTLHANALNKSLNKTVQGAVADVDLILFVVEAGSFTPADARVLALLGKGIPTVLVANKLDNIHRRGDVAPWLQTMQEKHDFAEFVPMSAKSARTSSACSPSARSTCPSSPGSTQKTS